MEGTCRGEEEDKFRPPAKTRQSIKSRLIDQEENKHRESGCSSPTMRTLGYKGRDEGSSWGIAVLSLKLLFGPSFHWQRKTRNKSIYLSCQNGLLLQWNDKTCRQTEARWYNIWGFTVHTISWNFVYRVILPLTVILTCRLKNSCLVEKRHNE